MIKDAILALNKKENLSYETAQAVMDEIMSGQASPVQMSSYLTALAMKGETIDEITGSAAGMRAHCIKLLHDMDVLEIVGTAATAPIPSTFPPLLPLSSPQPGVPGQQNTATAPRPPSAARRTCSRRWAFRSPSLRKRARKF